MSLVDDLRADAAEFERVAPRLTKKMALAADHIEQMSRALEEVREKAATMKNGGAWAAGLAALCLGTL